LTVSNVASISMIAAPTPGNDRSIARPPGPTGCRH
jgi:hypothetical protein